MFRKEMYEFFGVLFDMGNTCIGKGKVFYLSSYFFLFLH